ncbi:MAG: MFS transporter [Chloroflexi bacterium]|nr:MFS transporter [Chloroflexota bacterium]
MHLPARPHPGAPPAIPLLLGVLTVATFLTTGTGVTRAPFLLAMAADLQTTLAAVANLVSLSAISWGMASLASGILSDRIGRRQMLIVGQILMAVSMLGIALAPTYLAAAAWSLVSGVSGGTYMGAVFATVADHVPAERRGRALGWVMSGQSLALVLGVPLATLIGVVGGWRGAIGSQALAAAAIAVAIALIVPSRQPAAASAGPRPRPPSVRAALQPPIVALLVAGIAERVCYAGMVVYLAAYLTTSYGATLEALALALALVAVGNLAGNVIGGLTADRLPARPLFFAATLLATGALALPLYLWQPGLNQTVGLGFAFALANSAGRPALMATLSGVPAAVRGSVLGVNVSCASIGWITATALGGWLIGSGDFGGIGLLGAAMGLAGALAATLAWWLGRRPQPAAAMAAAPE